MSKRKQKEVLGKFIGLSAAHKILILLTNKPESVKKMQAEIDNYDELSIELSKGNWNNYDIEEIEQLAEKHCVRKLRAYEDIDGKKYSMIDEIIGEIMKELELK